MKKIVLSLLLSLSLLGDSIYEDVKANNMGKGYATLISKKVPSFERIPSNELCQEVIMYDISINTNIPEEERSYFYTDFFTKNPIDSEFATKVFKNCVLNLRTLKKNPPPSMLAKLQS